MTVEHLCGRLRDCQNPVLGCDGFIPSSSAPNTHTVPILPTQGFSKCSSRTISIIWNIARNAIRNSTGGTQLKSKNLTIPILPGVTLVLGKQC